MCIPLLLLGRGVWFSVSSVPSSLEHLSFLGLIHNCLRTIFGSPKVLSISFAVLFLLTLSEISSSIILIKDAVEEVDEDRGELKDMDEAGWITIAGIEIS